MLLHKKNIVQMLVKLKKKKVIQAFVFGRVCIFVLLDVQK